MATLTQKQHTQMQKKESSCRKLVPAVARPAEKDLAALDSEDVDLLLRAISEPVEYIDHPLFRKRGAEETLFGEDGESIDGNIGRFMPAPAFVADADLDSPGHTTIATLTTQQEQLLFQRFNFARCQVYRTLKNSKGESLAPAEMRNLVRWSKIASMVRAQIVQANMPLVLAMAKRTRLVSADFSDIVSEGNMALLRSVEKFDCSRGFKFSTYACRAILKAFSRVAIRASRYRSHFPTEFDPAMEKSDFLERRRQQVEDNCVDELRSVLAGNLADLSDVERQVIQARFALGAIDPEPARPLTLEEVGDIIGVTKECVRQIQNKALEKLRQTLEDNILTA